MEKEKEMVNEKAAGGFSDLRFRVIFKFSVLTRTSTLVILLPKP